MTLPPIRPRSRQQSIGSFQKIKFCMWFGAVTPSSSEWRQQWFSTANPCCTSRVFRFGVVHSHSLKWCRADRWSRRIFWLFRCLDWTNLPYSTLKKARNSLTKITITHSKLEVRNGAVPSKISSGQKTRTMAACCLAGLSIIFRKMSQVLTLDCCILSIKWISQSIEESYGCCMTVQQPSREQTVCAKWLAMM